MSWSVITANLGSAFFLLPFSLLALCMAGYFLRRKWPKSGMTLSAASLFVLILISTPAGALLLILPLEKLTVPLISTSNTGAQAIVVLGGGQFNPTQEHGGMGTPNVNTRMRLRYAAQLHAETGLPILVSGGAATGAPQSEATQMARFLRENLSTPVEWLEQASENTAQNAQFSARILQPVNAQRILLVTNAMHMARAKSIFARNGFDVVAAPTHFLARPDISPRDFIPEVAALNHASIAVNEWIGLVWYWFRY